MAAVGFVAGPPSPPQLEAYNTDQQDDLDATIPGTGIVLGGDGATAYPMVVIPPYRGPNPLTVPAGSRPLPTGTALGPDGQQYGFFSVVPYNSPGFVAPDAALVDLAAPNTALATLPSISQPSGAWDAASGRMAIVGNQGFRGLWMAAPKRCWLSKKQWWQNVGAPRYFSVPLQGNRENQIVALPGGGFLLVAAADYQPVVGAAASTPAGLLTAPAFVVAEHTSFPGGMYPYGPTVTNIEQNVDHLLITVRVSTFGLTGYDPQTWTTQFSLQGPVA